MEYEFFIPPQPMAEKDILTWSHKEAEQYFEWFLSNTGKRLALLGAYLNVTIQKNRTGLVSVVKKAESVFLDVAFSDGTTLTNRGYALAADIGILMGECILTAFSGQLTWKLWRERKNDLSYNRAVIVGFPSKLHIDPLHISIVQVHRILKGSHDHTTFLNVYDVWCEKARG